MLRFPSLRIALKRVEGGVRVVSSQPMAVQELATDTLGVSKVVGLARHGRGAIGVDGHFKP